MPNTNRRWTAATLIVAAAVVLSLIAGQACRTSTSRKDVDSVTASQPSMPPTLQQLAAPGAVNRAVLGTLNAQLDSLTAAIQVLDHQIRPGHSAEAQSAFRTARNDFKRVEGMIEFYAPDVAMALNGPLAEDNDDLPAPPLGAPAGFQLIEPIVFPRIDPAEIDTAHYEIANMLKNVERLRGSTQLLHVTYSQLFEAARLELARTTTLGLAGFDSDRSGNAVKEAAYSFDGLRDMFEAAAGPHGAIPKPWWYAIDTTFTTASAYLRAHSGFQQLDRLAFIVTYSGPASRAVATARREDKTPELIVRRVWNLSAATVFDSGALDPTAYSADGAPPLTPAVVQLGQRLFSEPLLSGARNRSCVTCHNPGLAFTDGRERAAVLNAQAQATARNTPTLINAAYQPALFFDERASSLEDQVGAVLANPAEMASSATLAADRLKAQPIYREAFARLFPHNHGGSLTPRTLEFVVAAYVRSLSAFDSRFDRAVRGDTTALSPQERHGFNLFMSKARCGTCHFAPLFNGTSPPTFTSSEVEIIGIPQHLATAHAHLDTDLGRGGFDRVSGHNYAFKVPTLRNIALTAPYMHNGAYRTLEQVVDFYNRGGGAGIGIKLPTQTLSGEPLHLTKAEESDLIAFLYTLTDTTLTTKSSAHPTTRLVASAR